MDPTNPYLPPAHDEAPAPPVAATGGLATLGQRFAARLIDNVLVTAVGFAGLFLIGNGFDDLQGSGVEAEMTAGLTLLVYMLPVSAIQWWLIASSGQSIGKRLLQIKIVRDDGTPCGFIGGVLMREWITTALAFIPMIGNFIGIVDALMIFGQTRKTLHDRIAGTKVVSAINLSYAEAESYLGHATALESPARPRRRKARRAFSPNEKSEENSSPE